MNTEATKNTYRLPFDEKLNITPRPAPKHKGSMVNALDFPMPEGTPIYAALDGIVIEVKQDSNKGGPDESFYPFFNVVRIAHANGENSSYVHLKHKGAVVKEQQNVKEGQLIGYSGTTGFTTYPHLHFGVYKVNDKGEKTYLRIRFRKDGKEFMF